MLQEPSNSRSPEPTTNTDIERGTVILVANGYMSHQFCRLGSDTRAQLKDKDAPLTEKCAMFGGLTQSLRMATGTRILEAARACDSPLETMCELEMGKALLNAERISKLLEVLVKRIDGQTYARLRSRFSDESPEFSELVLQAGEGPAMKLALIAYLQDAYKNILDAFVFSVLERRFEMRVQDRITFSYLQGAISKYGFPLGHLNRDSEEGWRKVAEISDLFEALFRYGRNAGVTLEELSQSCPTFEEQRLFKIRSYLPSARCIHALLGGLKLSSTNEAVITELHHRGARRLAEMGIHHFIQA